MLLGSIFMPEREETEVRTRFDWTGFVLLSVAIACLLTGLSNGQREGWNSDYILTLFAIAVAGRHRVRRCGSCTRRSRSSICACS